MFFYLDAGSGSLVAQAVVAGVAGTVVVAKLGWHRISAPFRRKPPAAPVDSSESSTERTPAER